MSLISQKKKITRDMVHNLQYDVNHKLKLNGDTGQQWDKPTLMIVFDGGDVNNAAHYVAQSAQDPFAANKIVSVHVQESIRNAFISKVRAQFKLLTPEVANHPNFLRTAEIVKRMNVTTIVANPEIAAAESSPTLVCDFSQNYFGSGPTGVVTMHTFRTAKEVLALCAKESMAFDSVSIWHANLACSYELAIKLAPPVCFFNSYAVSLDPIKAHYDAGSQHVTIVENYHYETLEFDARNKIIVFPIGTIFAN